MHQRNYIPTCTDCKVRCTSVFSGLHQDDLIELNAIKDANFCKKGHEIFAEGNRPKGIFVVHSGKVKVYKLGSNAKEQIVRLARPGDILGYRALLNNERYNASAASIEDSVICFIPRNRMMDLIDRHPSLSMNLIKLLSSDLANAENKVIEMIQKPVRERIAEAILLLKQIYGVGDDGKTLNVVLTREEIASFVGTTTETAIRVLSDFRSEGIVSFEKKHIVIEDLPKLMKESTFND